MSQLSYTAIGGCDEELPLGWEDVDFSLGALKAKFRLLECPDGTACGADSFSTRDASEELKLKRGQPALAIIKSTEVMIAVSGASETRRKPSKKKPAL